MAIYMAISVAKQYSIAEARDQLPALVHEAERGNHIKLTRRGKAVALLNSVEDYERLAPQQIDVWEKHAIERARLQAKGRSPSFADGQIAAVAKVNDLVVITKNTIDFEPFQEIDVDGWWA
jgi:prevent-host-death family protein